MKKSRHKPGGHVALGRALSKLGIASRAQAIEAIRAGRVTVDGRVCRNPSILVVPERVVIELDGRRRDRPSRRTIAFHKPRGVMTTRRDPEGRPTVFDLLGDEADGLVAVGRLDLATSGLLLLTSDTQLANWLTDPRHAIPRVYVLTVRGRITDADVAAISIGVTDRGDRLKPARVVLQKASGRESHLLVELTEGKNREIRRLFAAIDREVTRLKRVQFGDVELGALPPGEWRPIDDAGLRRQMAQDKPQ